jgi:hypothetical protein
MFYSNVDKSQHPKGFYEDLFNSYNDIEQNSYKMFAADVFENTMAFDDAKWKAFTGQTQCSEYCRRSCI